MNECSGKAMNCNLSGFYWTYLVLVGFFKMLSRSVEIKLRRKIHEQP